MSSSESDEDIHQCGRCKEIFRSIDDYFVHKKSKLCHKVKTSRSTEKIHEENVKVKATQNAFKKEKEKVKTVRKPENKTDTEQPMLTNVPPAENTEIVDTSISTRLKTRRRKAAPKKVWIEDYDNQLAESEQLEPFQPYRSTSRGRAQGRGGGKGRGRGRGSSNAVTKATIALKLNEIAGEGGKDIDFGILPKYASALTAKQLAQRKEAVILRSNKFYQCPECEYRAKHQDEYDRHLRTVHNLSTYICPKCLLPFRDKYKLKRHLDTKRCKGKDKLCDTPKYMPFTSSSRIYKKQLVSGGLSKAKKFDNNDDTDDDTDVKKEKKLPRVNMLFNFGISQPFTCNECDKTFDNYDGIIHHLDKHPDIFPGICRFCGRWFPSRYKLWRHMTSSIHDDIEETTMQAAKSEIQKLKINWPVEAMKKNVVFTKNECKKCNLLFSTKVKLLNHMKQVHVPVTIIKRFRCESCTQHFAKRADLLHHLKQDHAIDDPNALAQFKCAVCDRIFKQKSHVFRHRESLHTPVQQTPYTPPEDSDLELSESPDQSSDSSSSVTGNAKDSETEKSDDNAETNSQSKSLVIKEKKHEVFSCFVCFSIHENKDKLNRHLEMHRVWVPIPNEGPEPPDLFQNPPRIPTDRDKPIPRFIPPWENKKAKNSKQPSEDLSGEAEDADTSADTSATAESTAVFTPLTTIDQAAFSDLMQEQAKAMMQDQLESNVTVINILPEGCPLEMDKEAPETCETGAGIPATKKTDVDAVKKQGVMLDTESQSSSANIEVIEQTKSSETNKDQHLESKETPKKTNYKEMKYLCPYCIRLTSTLDDMYKHKVSEHKLQAVFKCVQPNCQQMFFDIKKFKLHNTVHSQRAFICNICNDHFLDTAALIGHKSSWHRNVHSAGGNHCSVCNKSFASKEALRAHTAKDLHHHQCHQCGAVMKSPCDLREHEARHQGVKSFLCEQCGATFVSKLALKRHTATHSPTKSHKCTECSAAFNKKEHLRRHKIAKHSSSKPFVCTHGDCGKAFARKDKLQEHLKAHSTEKPYVCTQCGRRYRYREGLKYHEKTHERTTKYTCSVCDVAFPRPGQLRSHLKFIHGINTKEQHLYPCMQCSSLFSRPERVKRHMEREHGVSALWKLYCTVCSRGFPGEKSLNSHMKCHHAPSSQGQVQKPKRGPRKARKAAFSKPPAPGPQQDLLACVMDQSLLPSVTVVPPGSSTQYTTSEGNLTDAQTDAQYTSGTMVVNIVHDAQPVRSHASTGIPPTPQITVITHHHQPLSQQMATSTAMESRYSEESRSDQLQQPVLAPIGNVVPVVPERMSPYVITENGSQPLSSPSYISTQGTSMAQYVTHDRHVLQPLLPVSYGTSDGKVGPESVKADEHCSPLTPIPLTVSTDRHLPISPGLGAGDRPNSSLAVTSSVQEIPPGMIVLSHQSNVPLSQNNQLQYLPTYGTIVNYDGRF